MLPWLVRCTSWRQRPASLRREIVGIALVFSLLGVCGQALAGAAPARTPDTALATASCAQASPTGSIDDEAMTMLSAGAPQGLTLVPLAASLAGQFPAGPSNVQLSQLILPPGAGADTRSAVGPILFYVEAGTITFFASGVAIAAAAGDAIIVDKDEYYTLENDGAAAASLLRLGVAPDDAGAQRIAVFDSPQDIAPTTATTLPESRLLVRAAISPLPTTSAWLILACVTLPAPNLAITGVQHPGPVGLWVETGPLGIQPGRELPAGGCTVFAAQTPHDLRSLDASAAALLFAVIPEGDRLWTDVAAVAKLAPTPLDDLVCGDPDSTG